MRESEFNQLMSDEFGPSYAGMVATGHHLADLDDRTAQEALTAGTSARRVWEAVCEAFDVPPQRRFGVDRPVVDRPAE